MLRNRVLLQNLGYREIKDSNYKKKSKKNYNNNNNNQLIHALDDYSFIYTVW